MREQDSLSNCAGRMERCSETSVFYKEHGGRSLAHKNIYELDAFYSIFEKNAIYLKNKLMISQKAGDPSQSLIRMEREAPERTRDLRNLVQIHQGT